VRILKRDFRECSSGPEPSRPSLSQKAAAGDEVSKASTKKTKVALVQKIASDGAGPKQPAAAEESFYTGRGVQPRKTIDGLPVFSVAEMVMLHLKCFCHDHVSTCHVRASTRTPAALRFAHLTVIAAINLCNSRIRSLHVACFQ
jgi:hypothetical protein